MDDASIAGCTRDSAARSREDGKSSRPASPCAGRPAAAAPDRPPPGTSPPPRRRRRPPSSSVSRYRAHDKPSASERGTATRRPPVFRGDETFSIVRGRPPPRTPRLEQRNGQRNAAGVELARHVLDHRSKSARPVELVDERQPGIRAGRPGADDLRLRLHPPRRRIPPPPSRTRSDRSTSMVKSTCPGVSIRWISLLHVKCVAAAVIVIPAPSPAAGNPSASRRRGPPHRWVIRRSRGAAR